MRKRFDWSYNPNWIHKIAEKTGTPVAEIAQIEKVDGNGVAWEWLRRDDVCGVFRISQIPDDPHSSLIQFGDGECIPVAMKHYELVIYLDNFLRMDVDYIVGNVIKKNPDQMTEEERAEMGDDPYLEED